MSYSGKDAAGDAATGAAAGSFLGPWGMAGGAGINVLANWLGSSGEEDPNDAMKRQAATMKEGGAQYAAYRPQAQNAREQGLRQQLSAYGGAANAMNLMYGSQFDPRVYAPDLGKNPYASGSGNVQQGMPQQQLGFRWDEASGEFVQEPLANATPMGQKWDGENFVSTPLPAPGTPAPQPQGLVWNGSDFVPAPMPGGK